MPITTDVLCCTLSSSRSIQGFIENVKHLKQRIDRLWSFAPRNTFYLIMSKQDVQADCIILKGRTSHFDQRQEGGLMGSVLAALLVRYSAN